MESAALTAELGSLTAGTEGEEGEESAAPVESTEESGEQANPNAELTAKIETVNACETPKGFLRVDG